jgi:hypothetical protein
MCVGSHQVPSGTRGEPGGDVCLNRHRRQEPMRFVQPTNPVPISEHLRMPSPTTDTLASRCPIRNPHDRLNRHRRGQSKSGLRPPMSERYG